MEIGELTPELKMIDLLIKRNLKEQLKPINNNINSLLNTAKITEKNALEITNLKKEKLILETTVSKVRDGAEAHQRKIRQNGKLSVRKQSNTPWNSRKPLYGNTLNQGMPKSLMIWHL